MSRTLDKVMLIGNVGKKTDFKRTPSGIPVTSFRLATSEVWGDREGKQHEHTHWHTIVAWRGLAELIDKIVNSGSRVFVEGKIQSRKIDDNDSSQIQVYEILADNIILLEKKKEEEIESISNYDFNEFDSYERNDDSPNTY